MNPPVAWAIRKKVSLLQVNLPVPDIVDNLRELGKRTAARSTLVRLIRACGLLVGIFGIGTLGFWIGSPDEYGVLEAAFMTVITLTTVGYGEVIPVSEEPALAAFTIALIVSGMGVMLYFASSLTAFIIEGELQKLLTKRYMKRRIKRLKNHFIIAGIGSTGAHVLREVQKSNRECVVIERDQDRIDEEFAEQRDFLYIQGDATNDDVLKRAGVERAGGLVVSLGNERDNLFVTITARNLNKDLRIVARGVHPNGEEKFKRAGADSVIYTNVLGGMRMAAEVIRPEVTTFLDLMMKDNDHYRRVEEIPVPEDSPLIGRTIREADIRRHANALIVAVHLADRDEYIFNPEPDFEFRPGCKLIVLTLVEDIDAIERLVRGASSAETPTSEGRW
ncbi:MAG: potassium channel family protein [Persicimonas sp.]